MESYSFPPVEDSNSRLLILGTMPGKTSLEINEYYGYKHNTFWKIMFEIFETEYTDSYANKKKLLINNRVALWDTLKHCERKGSLDSDIKKEIPNNFKIFFQKHIEIRDVIFNGGASFKYYKKYIGLNNQLSFHILPSTSPANARKNYQKKLAEWKIIKQILENRS